MASFVFFIVTTFQIWACHVTCVYRLAKNFIAQDTLLILGKSLNMSLVPALVEKLLKTFFGGLKGPPPGEIELSMIKSHAYNINIIFAFFTNLSFVIQICTTFEK